MPRVAAAGRVAGRTAGRVRCPRGGRRGRPAPRHTAERRMRVLVLGGAGFLGSHLCERLLDRGDEVLAMDNLQTGALQNIAHLRDNERFTFVEHVVPEPFYVPVDRVYNLACPASPPQYQADPV